MANVTSDSSWQRLAEMTFSYGGLNEFNISFTRSNIEEKQVLDKDSEEDSISEHEDFLPVSDSTKHESIDLLENMGFKFEDVDKKKPISKLNLIINKKHGESLNMKIKRKQFSEFSKENKKYWHSRHMLFSKFDCGIQLDQESWFSVTPELLARHIATRLKCRTVIDAFCGAGGNAIQFAMVCDKVIAIDIDPKKIQMARHNASLYGVEHKIVFVNKDFLKFVPDSRSRADVVFLSPPWGGPSYRNKDTFSLKAVTPDIDKIMEKSRSMTDNIAIYLPRNTVVEELVKYAGGNPFEVEQNVMSGRLKTLTAYYGNLVNSSIDPISPQSVTCNRREIVERSWRIPRNMDFQGNAISKWEVEKSVDEKLSMRPMAFKNFNNRAGNKCYDSIKPMKSQGWQEPKYHEYSKLNDKSTLEEKLAAAPRQYKNFMKKHNLREINVF